MTVTGLRDWFVDHAGDFAVAASACTPEAGLSERREVWERCGDDRQASDVVPAAGGVHVVGTTTR